MKNAEPHWRERDEVERSLLLEYTGQPDLGAGGRICNNNGRCQHRLIMPLTQVEFSALRVSMRKAVGQMLAQASTFD